MRRLLVKNKYIFKHTGSKQSKEVHQNSFDQSAGDETINPQLVPRPDLLTEINDMPQSKILVVTIYITYVYNY